MGVKEGAAYEFKIGGIQMNTKTRIFSGAPLLLASLVVGGCVLLHASNAGATTQYMDDGGLQNSSGTWDMPKSSQGDGTLGQGYCVPVAAQNMRPLCLALRLEAASSSACTTLGGSWSTSAQCNDTETDQASCEAQPNRLWTAWAVGGKCALTLKDRNRNQASCEDEGGVWQVGYGTGAGTCQGVWTYPDSASYTPPLLRPVAANPGVGDQCLRCHNSMKQYNGNRVRDVEGFLKTGHANMVRKVTPGSGLPWSGPDGTPYATNDAGKVFDWANGTINIGTALVPNWQPVNWLYGDWLGPLPRAVYPGSGSYSCGRCHNTGYVSSVDATREPRLSFPAITNSITGSWDTWGITCSRCHGSALEDAAGGSCSVTGLFSNAACTDGGGTWTSGGAMPAQLGMTSHASNLVAFDGGYCINPPDVVTGLPIQQKGQGNKLQCADAGGTWYSMCTDDRWQTSGQCVAASGCINPGNSHGLTFTSSATCTVAGECTNPYFTTNASCTAGGGAWTPADGTWWASKSPAKWAAGSCSVGADGVVGVCTAPQYTTSGACTTAGGTWGTLCSNPRYVSQSTCTVAGATWSTGACTQAAATTAAACKDAYGVWSPAWSDLFRCMDAGGTWSGTLSRRGQRITQMCADCHRQEASSLPMDVTDPAGNLKVGPAHNTVGFVSHPHTNQFLNSPHGQFTGTFSQIGSATYGNGYGSYFQFMGEASGTGNGCTGCHDVHESVVPETGQEGAIHEECEECHGKNLAAMAHPMGAGTPFENMATDPAEACEICHMPEKLHLFRINTDPTYSTFPAGALAGTVNATQQADGSYGRAVWVDLDAACGQCHGGGATQASSIADVSGAAVTVETGKGANFTVGARVSIAGAGALEEDGVTRADLETYIKTIVGDTLTLAAAVVNNVTGTTIEQNPTANGGAYITKAQLAQYAEGIHNDKPVVSWGYKLGLAPNTLTVNVDGSASRCAGTCEAYDWDWGDGTAHGSGVTASHTYLTGGSKTITLTVEEYGVNGASLSKSVTVYAPDLPPTVGGACGIDANTWIATVTDTSTDDKNGGLPKQVTVNWGDGSMLSNDTTAPFGPFTRTYANAGTYTITHKAIDTIGQASSTTCSVSPAYFSIAGTVKNTLGTANLASANVKLKKNGVVVKTVYTTSTGTFSAGSLKPGTYTLEVTKSGYTFTVPAATITIGPSSAGNTINSLTP